ncbi:MAG: hypothetical protein IJQ81_01735 [Oscillibacter sp.]|nr:hypothetical protein [Oscillibacter sp.]
MIYADYISDTGDSVTYAFGATIYDITGIVTFNLTEGWFEVEKEPDKEHVSIRYISRLFRKYRDDFYKGIFKPKISYEI